MCIFDRQSVWLRVPRPEGEAGSEVPSVPRGGGRARAPRGQADGAVRGPAGDQVLYCTVNCTVLYCTVHCTVLWLVTRERNTVRRQQTRNQIDRLVEDLIVESMANGEFDNLGGAGKPLPNRQDLWLKWRLCILRPINFSFLTAVIWVNLHRIFL